MNGLIPIPNILDRAFQYVTFQYINNSDILGYRIRVANSLDNAYGNANGVTGVGTTALFDVLRGQCYISKAVRTRRTALSGDSLRGQTRATFDPNEFFGLSPEVPPDSGLWFVRTQVSTVTTAAIAGSVQAGFPGGVFPGTASPDDQSEILIMQDPTFFSVPRPSLTLYGTAPDNGAVPGLPAPPQALIFHVPAFADAMVLTNHGAAPLLFTVGRDQPLMQITPMSSISHSSGMKDEIVICANGANPTFSILLSIVIGMR